MNGWDVSAKHDVVFRKEARVGGHGMGVLPDCLCPLTLHDYYYYYYSLVARRK